MPTTNTPDNFGSILADFEKRLRIMENRQHYPTVYAGYVATSENISIPGGGFVDLATLGPQLLHVEVGPSGLLLVIPSADMAVGVGGNCYMGYEVLSEETGLVVDAPFVDFSIHLGDGASGTIAAACAGVFSAPNLSDGLYTVTAKYATNGAAAAWEFRNLYAIPL